MESKLEDKVASGAMDLEEEEEEVDELALAFDTLEASTDTVSSKVQQYKALLVNSRTDDKALKIREQCIYRWENNLTTDFICNP